MALPPQALEQLAREPMHTPGWSGKLLMFSSTLFIISLFAWVGLSYGYAPFLTKQSDQYDKDLAAAAKQINIDTQRELISFYSQLANLDKIIDNHVYASTLFDLLEARVHGNIFFNKLDVNTETGKMILGGVAKSVKDVTEQAKLLEADPKVASVFLGNVSAQSGGLWQFDLTVNFKEKMLAKAPENSAPIVAGPLPTSTFAGIPLPSTSTATSTGPKATTTPR
jgi:hypothetical protein